MYKLQDTSLEWALLHVTNFYDSDFFPKLFEFEAIKHNWANIKPYLLGLDIENYTPKNPVTSLAPKPNGSYRVVHQLDPIDSILYAALVYENSSLIEAYRIPEARKIAFSYRIKPDLTGSFFEKEYGGYTELLSQAHDLADEYEDGKVLVCDIVDFYNQINLHRVNNFLSEAGSDAAKATEWFLGEMNTKVSRGIPVGPGASKVIAEGIMGDINKKILTYTKSFVQYVDDIYIFFRDDYTAKWVLHELTRYSYSNHRLVLSPEKTRIVGIDFFREAYLMEESRTEREALHKKLEELAAEEYGSEEETKEFDDLEDPEKFKIRSQAYKDLFEEAVKGRRIELGLMRHILRQAGIYKVKSIIPQIFSNFVKLLPVLREIVIYFNRVLNEKLVKKYKLNFEKLLSLPYLSMPFINIWIFTLFQNEHFNKVEIEIDYSKILRTREKALIARRTKDLTWFKDIKDGVDTLGSWDRRAVVYASSILSKDEANHWLKLERSKGDVVNQSICSMVLNQIKSRK